MLALLLVCATAGATEKSVSRPGRAAITNEQMREGRSLVGFQDDAASALARGDYAQALASSEAGLALYPRDGFLAYDRGSALVGLGRVDEGVRALHDSEALLPDARWKSLAAYRAFLGLDQAGRCAESQGWLEHYASLAPNPSDVTMARNVQQSCHLERQTVRGGR